MRRHRRLRTDAEFEAVRKRGRGWSSGVLVLRALVNGLPYSRFGYLVSKKVGKAVVRNLVRRRIREAARLATVVPGWDIVFIARSGAADASYAVIEQTMRELLRRARLLAEPRGTEVTLAEHS